MEGSMKSFAEEATRREVLARIESVDDSTVPKWGKFTARAMLDHIARAMEMSAGERAVGPKKTPARYFPIKQLFIYMLPMPKGLPTAPELLTDSPEPVEKSKETLRRLITAFAPQAGAHPAFGWMSVRAWNV